MRRPFACVVLAITVSAVCFGQTPPTATKAFAPDRIAPGETTTLTFTINNPNAATLTGVGFTDTFPSGLTVFTPNGLTGSCGGGTITAVAGSNSVSLSGATLPPSTSCSFSVTVTASHEDSLLNSTGAVSSSLGSGAAATATLIVGSRPVLTKTFGAVSIGAGSSIGLTFTLSNPNVFSTLVGLAFSDTLPAGLVVSNPNGLSGSCGGGTITAVAGSSSIALTGASLAPGAACTFSVNVRATGTPEGALTNNTSTVTSQGPAGLAATASIFVGTPFQVSYFPNLNLGDSVINITNAGTLGAGTPSGITAAVTGALCVNVYAFSPDEQLVACCSCPVTPNGLVSLSAVSDLISNTLTPAQPTAIVVKLLATVPVGGTCANSAAAVGTATLANGMAAWGTKMHSTEGPAAGGTVYAAGAVPVPVRAYGTEVAFVPVSLSSGQLSRLGNLCTFIVSNGSGFGICRSCRLGGLGAAGR